MKSPVVKRSIVIAGHKTSVSLEDAFWQGLKDIATSRQMTLSEWSAASIPIASTAISRRRYGYSCSITIRPGPVGLHREPTATTVSRADADQRRLVAFCGKRSSKPGIGDMGSQWHASDRIPIAPTPHTQTTLAGPGALPQSSRAWHFPQMCLRPSGNRAPSRHCS